MTTGEDGQSFGIGAIVGQDSDNCLCISYLVPNGPADAANSIGVGDLLVEIDDEVVKHLTPTEALSRILGPLNSTVSLGLLPCAKITGPGWKKQMPDLSFVTVERRWLQTQSSRCSGQVLLLSNYASVLGRWAKRWAVLNGDILSFAKTKDSAARGHMQLVLCVSQCSFIALNTKPAFKHTFALYSPAACHKQSCLFVRLDRTDALEKWTMHLKGRCDQQLLTHARLELHRPRLCGTRSACVLLYRTAQEGIEHLQRLKDSPLNATSKRDVLGGPTSEPDLDADDALPRDPMLADERLALANELMQSLDLQLKACIVERDGLTAQLEVLQLDNEVQLTKIASLEERLDEELSKRISEIGVLAPQITPRKAAAQSQLLDAIVEEEDDDSTRPLVDRQEANECETTGEKKLDGSWVGHEATGHAATVIPPTGKPWPAPTPPSDAWPAPTPPSAHNGPSLDANYWKNRAVFLQKMLDESCRTQPNPSAQHPFDPPHKSNRRAALSSSPSDQSSGSEMPIKSSITERKAADWHIAVWTQYASRRSQLDTRTRLATVLQIRRSILRQLGSRSTYRIILESISHTRRLPPSVCAVLELVLLSLGDISEHVQLSKVSHWNQYCTLLRNATQQHQKGFIERLVEFEPRGASRSWDSIRKQLAKLQLPPDLNGIDDSFVQALIRRTPPHEVRRLPDLLQLLHQWVLVIVEVHNIAAERRSGDGKMAESSWMNQMADEGGGDGSKDFWV